MSADTKWVIGLLCAVIFWLAVVVVRNAPEHPDSIRGRCGTPAAASWCDPGE